MHRFLYSLKPASLMRTNFLERLATAQRRADSVLCVGIDPDLERIPDAVLVGKEPHEAVLNFCREIIAATHHVACAFKFNFAFFEALGWRGFQTLELLLDEVPSEILTIADAKRGDIGNTARMYADAIFERMGFDACTISPYMGRDSVEPFLEHPGTCTFVLARTSNPGGNDFQTFDVDGQPLYQRIATSVREWAEHLPATAGLVVGASDLDALRALRREAPDMPFLIPGIGAQGGDARDVMRAASGGPIVVNSSRQILYSSTRSDFAEAAAKAASETAASLPGPPG